MSDIWMNVYLLLHIVKDVVVVKLFPSIHPVIHPWMASRDPSIHPWMHGWMASYREENSGRNK
jgi:hypothetical protein